MHTYLFFSLGLLGFFNDCVHHGLLCDYSNTLFEITISNHYNVVKESPAVTSLMKINVLLYLAGTEIIAVVM